MSLVGSGNLPSDHPAVLSQVAWPWTDPSVFVVVRPPRRRNGPHADVRGCRAAQRCHTRKSTSYITSWASEKRRGDSPFRSARVPTVLHEPSWSAPQSCYGWPGLDL